MAQYWATPRPSIWSLSLAQLTLGMKGRTPQYRVTKGSDLRI